jgi:L,D-peptidoglycan transpeptidase YkuD (ErfK/YbiS/YcfS/YnhG family)
MLREDGLYDIGAVIDYNPEGKKDAGSCIFMHIANKEGKPTAGCIALKKEDMEQIASMLSKNKTPIIEIKE